LFYETLDNHIMTVDCSARGNSFEAGKPSLWSSRWIMPVPVPVANMDLHPDGKRFLVFSEPETSTEQRNSVHATLLLNFSDELKRRIP